MLRTSTRFDTSCIAPPLLKEQRLVPDSARRSLEADLSHQLSVFSSIEPEWDILAAEEGDILKARQHRLHFHSNRRTSTLLRAPESAARRASHAPSSAATAWDAGPPTYSNRRSGSSALVQGRPSR